MFDQLIAFQTGRRYTTHGQRIGACVLTGTNKCYFVDIDREIEGFFTLPSGKTDIDPDMIMSFYDNDLSSNEWFPVDQKLKTAVRDIAAKLEDE